MPLTVQQRALIQNWARRGMIDAKAILDELEEAGLPSTTSAPLSVTGETESAGSARVSFPIFNDPMKSGEVTTGIGIFQVDGQGDCANLKCYAAVLEDGFQPVVEVFASQGSVQVALSKFDTTGQGRGSGYIKLALGDPPCIELTSPSGSSFRVTVSDAGELVVAPA